MSVKQFRRMTWNGYAEIKHGTLMSIEDLKRLRREEEQLLDANEAVIRVLEDAGIPCRRTDGNRVVSIHSVTDEQTELDQLRNLNILPRVQVFKRRGDVVTLEAYCSLYPWGLRMRLITSGTRCPIEELGERIDFLHETIRRLPSRKWFAKIAELISAGIEFTATPGPDGRLMYHVHAHVIYRVLHRISKEDFREFLRHWKKHFRGRYCPDSGRIRDIREGCKYPTKAADLLGILRGGELPALYYQLDGRKLFQTYAGLRKLRTDLRKSREKIKRRKLTSKESEAVTSPQQPLIEYVRVAPQPVTRVRYGKKRNQDAKPTNIFLGRSHPFPDSTGCVGVGERWLNGRAPAADHAVSAAE